MAAAENGALPRGKVGGMGDVIRDLPLALAKRGLDVTVVTPAYGMFAALPGARQAERFDVPFGGRTESVTRYELPSEHACLHWQVLEHPMFSPSGGRRIYHDDGPGSPFYTDAIKFAFFSAALAELALNCSDGPDVVHLHDWHLGLFFALRAYDPRYRKLQAIRSVFTIHNLALQGTRPLEGSDSSLRAWFPKLRDFDGSIRDPQYSDCVNPMATAIRLADMVNTVSPSYAAEILRPPSEATGFRGGEGLETELVNARSQGRLVGILNGCDYSAAAVCRAGWEKTVATIESELLLTIADQPSLPSAHYLAARRLAELPKKRPDVVLTSVGRLSEQKVRLFREPTGNGSTALGRLLEDLGDQAVLIVLGSGDAGLERFFAETSVRYRNLLFLQAYSDGLAGLLYAAGDLFLMPSSFEPCGISQMLAMRAGQPCVVHAVGGLRDTVTDATGFPFDGPTPAEQATNFVATVRRAVRLRSTDEIAWRRLKEAASAKRFDWATSAARYASEVYAIDAG